MGLFTKKKKPQKRKNVSQKIRNGTTLQTRDEFLESGKNYKKPGYEKKGLYRKVVVVDSNRNDELAVVKTSTKGKRIKGEKKSRFKPFVETKDSDNKPIKVGKKFIQNKPKKSLNKSQVSQIKKETFKNARKDIVKENQSKVRKLKGRK